MVQKIPYESHFIICKKYKSGINTPQIAKEYGVNPTTIRNILIKNNVVLRSSQTSNRKMKFHTEEIFKLYKKGLSSVEIAKKFNVNNSTILRELRKSGVKIRKGKDYRVYSCNLDFFENLNTEEKAYWIGFIAADGSVNKRKKQSSLTISLSSRDRSHLEKFKTSIKSSHPIRDYKVGEYDVSSVSISSRKLVKDLIKYNIVQNKSLIYSMPKNIPNHLLNHFIRGYVDGDGGFYCGKTKRGYSYHSFEVTSSVTFSKEIQKLLMKECNLNKTKMASTGKAKTVRYSGRRQIRRIHDWIYKNATLWLERKRLTSELD